MVVGYARTSTAGQIAGLETQERELRAVGCDKIFREQVSSVAEREQLEAALDYLCEGDQFVCTTLDRLARSVGDLLAIVARLEAKKVSLRVLSSVPTARRQSAEIIGLRQEGVRAAEIARKLNVGRASPPVSASLWHAIAHPCRIMSGCCSTGIASATLR
jgi:resolvase-like protein